MKRLYVLTFFCVLLLAVFQFISCNESKLKTEKNEPAIADTDSLFKVDTTKIPGNKYGEAIKYGRELMLRTAYYIGPNGVNGKYLGNKMNCTNCHQDAGTKPYSFNLMITFKNYPQYRSREGKVLSLAERINNCIMHPHLGKPLPLDSKEMIAFISYLKWISDSSGIDKNTPGIKGIPITFPSVAASSERGAKLYENNCARCHGAAGEGLMQANGETYTYPPLWGMKAYQPGSSMHRIIKMSQWLIANMPNDKATHQKPFLTTEEAFDLSAFVNDDDIHKRPPVGEFQYPHNEEKAIDYGEGPFADTFSVAQHRLGPYQPIIDYWKSKGWKPSY